MTGGAAFLLSKDPGTEHGGDVTMSKLLVRLAREVMPVQVICLSRGGSAVVSTSNLVRVRKPAVDPLRLAWHSARSGRSLVHTRFDLPELRDAIEATEADVFVTDHSYMAESFVASDRVGRSRLAVTTGVSESLIWRSTRGRLLQLETPRIERDELRIARAADVVGTFDSDEAQRYRGFGVRGAQWLDVTLAPASKLDLAGSSRRLVFMGTRSWRPNLEALEILLRWWPSIARGIAGAELSIIGPGRAHPGPLPAGVVDRGFVPNLPEFLGTCRALVAPIATGGGVRVKMLEAASHGLPVVGTAAALGSHGPVLGLSAFDDAQAFIGQCRHLLLDRRAAMAAGQQLYHRNAERWHHALPHRAVESLLDRPVQGPSNAD